jgi:hypothetical protein
MALFSLGMSSCPDTSTRLQATFARPCFLLSSKS